MPSIAPFRNEAVSIALQCHTPPRSTTDRTIYALAILEHGTYQYGPATCSDDLRSWPRQASAAALELLVASEQTAFKKGGAVSVITMVERNHTLYMTNVNISSPSGKRFRDSDENNIALACVEMVLNDDDDPL